MTKGKFGFHRGAGKYELGPAATYVQIYVKASALSGNRILQSQRT